MGVEPDDATARLTRLAERAFRVHAVARALECTCAGALAAALAFWVARADGAAASASLIAVAALCGALAAGTLWAERPAARARFERAVDRRAGLDGALATTLGAERSQRRSALLPLLAARVEHALPPRAFLASALPRPLAVFAPLLFTGALLAAVPREQPPARAPLASEPGNAARAAASAGTDRDRPDPDAIAAEEARRALGLATPAARRQAALDQSRAFATAALAEPEGSALRAEFERRAAELAAIAAGTEPAAVGAQPFSGAPAPPAGAPGLASGPAGPTMPGPAGPAASSRTPAATDPAQRRAASAPGLRWWPARHDAIVERWLGP